jgi:hypothetical protein
LAMVPQKQQKKWKKGEQALYLSNLGDDVLEATKKKKEGASSSSAESWWWHGKSNKKKRKNGELRLPFYRDLAVELKN